MKAFLESEFPPRTSTTAGCHIITAPYEETVSYGGGTRNGPEAIIEASQQLEAFDGEGTPGDLGLYTHRLACESAGWQDAGALIREAVIEALDQRAFPLLLGGEHSVTLPAVEAVRQSIGDTPFGILHLDAHADLRDTYQGSPYSHACVMRRISELGIPIAQIGIRSLCLEEVAYREQTSIVAVDAADWKGVQSLISVLPGSFPSTVYLSVDVDVFDCSLMPATGTPEPGGLFWNDCMEILRFAAEKFRVIGADIVELAPIAGLHHCDYTSAKLAYRIIGLARKSQSRETGCQGSGPGVL